MHSVLGLAMDRAGEALTWRDFWNGIVRLNPWALEWYEGTTKWTAWLTGLRGADVIIDEKEAYVEHPGFRPRGDWTWRDKARDVAIAASGPLVSLAIGVGALAALGIYHYALFSHSPPFLELLTASLTTSLLFLFVVVPFLTLGAGNLLLTHDPRSRGYRILYDLGLKGKDDAIEYPERQHDVLKRDRTGRQPPKKGEGLGSIDFTLLGRRPDWKKDVPAPRTRNPRSELIQRYLGLGLSKPGVQKVFLRWAGFRLRLSTVLGPAIVPKQPDAKGDGQNQGGGQYESRLRHGFYTSLLRMVAMTYKTWRWFMSSVIGRTKSSLSDAPHEFKATNQIIPSLVQIGLAEGSGSALKVVRSKTQEIEQDVSAAHIPGAVYTNDLVERAMGRARGTSWEKVVQAAKSVVENYPAMGHWTRRAVRRFRQSLLAYTVLHWVIWLAERHPTGAPPLSQLTYQECAEFVRIYNRLEDDTLLHEGAERLLQEWAQQKPGEVRPLQEKVLALKESLEPKANALGLPLLAYAFHLVAQLVDDHGWERTPYQDLDKDDFAHAEIFFSLLPKNHEVRQLYRGREQGKNLHGFTEAEMEEPTTQGGEYLAKVATQLHRHQMFEILKRHWPTEDTVRHDSPTHVLLGKLASGVLVLDALRAAPLPALNSYERDNLPSLFNVHDTIGWSEKQMRFAFDLLQDVYDRLVHSQAQASLIAQMESFLEGPVPGFQEPAKATQEFFRTLVRRYWVERGCLTQGEEQAARATIAGLAQKKPPAELPPAPSVGSEQPAKPDDGEPDPHRMVANTWWANLYENNWESFQHPFWKRPRVRWFFRLKPVRWFAAVALTAVMETKVFFWDPARKIANSLTVSALKTFKTDRAAAFAEAHFKSKKYFKGDSPIPQKISELGEEEQSRLRADFAASGERYADPFQAALEHSLKRLGWPFAKALNRTRLAIAYLKTAWRHLMENAGYWRTGQPLRMAPSGFEPVLVNIRLLATYNEAADSFALIAGAETFLQKLTRSGQPLILSAPTRRQIDRFTQQFPALSGFFAEARVQEEFSNGRGSVPKEKEAPTLRGAAEDQRIIQEVIEAFGGPDRSQTLDTGGQRKWSFSSPRGLTVEADFQGSLLSIYVYKHRIIMAPPTLRFSVALLDAQDQVVSSEVVGPDTGGVYRVEAQFGRRYAVRPVVTEQEGETLPHAEIARRPAAAPAGSSPMRLWINALLVLAWMAGLGTGVFLVWNYSYVLEGFWRVFLESTALTGWVLLLSLIDRRFFYGKLAGAAFGVVGIHLLFHWHSPHDLAFFVNLADSFFKRFLSYFLAGVLVRNLDEVWPVSGPKEFGRKFLTALKNPDTWAEKKKHGWRWGLSMGLVTGYFIYYVFFPFLTVAFPDALPGNAILRTVLDATIVAVATNYPMATVVGAVFGENQNVWKKVKETFRTMGVIYPIGLGVVIPMMYAIWRYVPPDYFRWGHMVTSTVWAFVVALTVHQFFSDRGASATSAVAGQSTAGGRDSLHGTEPRARPLSPDRLRPVPYISTATLLLLPITWPLVLGWSVLSWWLARRLDDDTRQWLEFELRDALKVREDIVLGSDSIKLMSYPQERVSFWVHLVGFFAYSQGDTLYLSPLLAWAYRGLLLLHHVPRRPRFQGRFEAFVWRLSRDGLRWYGRLCLIGLRMVAPIVVAFCMKPFTPSIVRAILTQRFEHLPRSQAPAEVSFPWVMQVRSALAAYEKAAEARALVFWVPSVASLNQELSKRQPRLARVRRRLEKLIAGLDKTNSLGRDKDELAQHLQAALNAVDEALGRVVHRKTSLQVGETLLHIIPGSYEEVTYRIQQIEGRWVWLERGDHWLPIPRRALNDETWFLMRPPADNEQGGQTRARGEANKMEAGRAAEPDPHHRMVANTWWANLYENNWESFQHPFWKLPLVRGFFRLQPVRWFVAVVLTAVMETKVFFWDTGLGVARNLTQAA